MGMAETPRAVSAAGRRVRRLRPISGSGWLVDGLTVRPANVMPVSIKSALVRLPVLTSVRGTCEGDGKPESDEPYDRPVAHKRRATWYA